MRLVIVFLGLALLFTVPFLIWGDGFERTFSVEGTGTWLGSFGAWAWMAAIGLLCADLVLPVPATAVISALGYQYGVVAGALIGAGGSFLAGLLAYSICRLVGPRAAVWIVGERDLERGERFLGRLGGWAVAVSRWMPLLPEVVACLAGMVRMRFGVFCAALACGSVPMALTFAAVGASGERHPTLAIVLSAVVPVILWPVARRVLDRSGERS